MDNVSVLVVDDSDDWRNTLFGVLSDEGFIAYTAGSAIDAIQILTDRSIDMAILDIRMDDSDEENVDGLLVAAEIQNKWPGTKIVILTGYSSLDTVRIAFSKYKVVDFLQKSDAGKLPDILKEHLLKTNTYKNKE